MTPTPTTPSATDLATPAPSTEIRPAAVSETGDGITAGVVFAILGGCFALWMADLSLVVGGCAAMVSGVFGVLFAEA